MKITATQIFCLVFVLYVSVACAKKKNVIKEQPKKNTTEEQHPKIRLYNKNAYLRPTKCQGKWFDNNESKFRIILIIFAVVSKKCLSP